MAAAEGQGTPRARVRRDTRVRCRGTDSPQPAAKPPSAAIAASASAAAASGGGGAGPSAASPIGALVARPLAGHRRHRRRGRGSARICRRSSRSKSPSARPRSRSSTCNGQLLATRGDMGGAAVPLKELPRYVPQAFIAIEDRRFYSHYGVDPIGIARAVVANIAAPRRVAGRLDADPAARQEPVPDAGAHARAQGAGGGAGALAGAQIQQGRRSSSSISTASISAPAPTASRRRRSAISASPRRKLTLAEAAMLAGLVKSPSRLAPTRNPDGAEKRAQIVLAAMADMKLHHRRHGQDRADAAGACDQEPPARARSAMSPTGSWTCSTT